MITLLLLKFLVMTSVTTLTVESPAFKHNELIPALYTCEGENTSPPLTISGIPEETKSIALIMDDPDATSGTFDHWICWNISPGGVIQPNTIPGVEGLNGRGRPGYTGPCPPSGRHRYFFKAYALDIALPLAPGSRKHELEKAMQGHIIATGELIGLYEKTGNK